MTNSDKQKDFHESIASSRHNSFLVATAFMIAAYVTLIIVDNEIHGVSWLAHAINCVGLYLAIFFTIANFHAVLVAKLVHEGKPVEAGINSIACGIFKDLKRLFLNPTEFRGRTELIHTWLIPLLFVVFWILTWFFVLNNWKVPTIFISITFAYLAFQVIQAGIKKRK